MRREGKGDGVSLEKTPVPFSFLGQSWPLGRRAVSYYNNAFRKAPRHGRVILPWS